jgi:YqaJ-like viral recombinase domain
MSPIIHRDVEQGTPEWFALRVGKPTASMFHAILAKGEGKTRKKYLYQLASERITGEPTESYSNPYLDRGKAQEEEARNLYSFLSACDALRVGFIERGISPTAGCSPDSLIGDAGGLEIKTQRADLLVETLFKDEFPSEHKAQVQGNLWICEREWWDLMVYAPKMPPFIKRAYRDEGYIANLEREVSSFNEDLERTVSEIRKRQ